jgi:hypothetical protein
MLKHNLPSVMLKHNLPLPTNGGRNAHDSTPVSRRLLAAGYFRRRHSQAAMKPVNRSARAPGSGSAFLVAMVVEISSA